MPTGKTPPFTFGDPDDRGRTSMPLQNGVPQMTNVPKSEYREFRELALLYRQNPRKAGLKRGEAIASQADAHSKQLWPKYCEFMRNSKPHERRFVIGKVTRWAQLNVKGFELLTEQRCRRLIERVKRRHQQRAADPRPIR